MKIIPRLEELYQDEELMAGICPAGIMGITNVDDIFRTLTQNDIKEVCVNREEMFLIARFMVANTSISQKISQLAWRVLSEGKVNKFMGIKLQLC